jgi:hypothetical protein
MERAIKTVENDGAKAQQEYDRCEHFFHNIWHANTNPFGVCKFLLVVLF